MDERVLPLKLKSGMDASGFNIVRLNESTAENTRNESVMLFYYD